MIIGIDIETMGLEARPNAFVVGCVMREDFKHKIFYKPKLMWESIIRLGKKLSKHGEVLNVYAHNMGGYDYMIIYDRDERENIKYYSMDTPFIANYMYKGKCAVKFLDTMSLYRMGLNGLGKLLGKPKGITPSYLLEGRKLTQDEISDCIPYCINDTKIVVEGVLRVKNKIESEGYSMKRLITIHQIANQYMMNKLKESGIKNFFFNESRNQVYFTKWEKQVHEAYRAGRCECFKTGVIDNVTYIDVNSLYPYIARSIRFPDLTSQKKLQYPLYNYSKEELFNQIGIHRTLVLNESNEIGLLPVRTPTFSYYPRKGKIFVGTYTSNELKECEKQGYKILAIDFSIVWKDNEFNPLYEIMGEIYSKRKASGNAFDDHFYKCMGNNSLGKFGQIRTGQELVVDDIEAMNTYIKNGYKMLRGFKGSYDMIFKKDNVGLERKPYYCPIIPITVNADARIYMFKNYKKVGFKDLVYTDNDSIMFVGNHLNKFDIGNGLGQFKVVEENEQALIWGRKTYNIGKELKASGVHRGDLNKEDFENGYAETNKVIGIRSGSEKEEIGRFKKERRDFIKQHNEYNIISDKLEKEDFFIDFTIENMGSLFEERIKELISLD